MYSQACLHLFEFLLWPTKVGLCHSSISVNNCLDIKRRIIIIIIDIPQPQPLIGIVCDNMMGI